MSMQRRYILHNRSCAGHTHVTPSYLLACNQEKQSLQEEVAKLELLVQAQQDKLVRTGATIK